MFGILADCHGHANQFLLLKLRSLDRTKPLSRFIERLRANGIQSDRAGGHFAHPRFAIDLRRRQIPCNGGVGGADADQFANRSQSATENGNGEDHLQE